MCQLLFETLVIERWKRHWVLTSEKHGQRPPGEGSRTHWKDGTEEELLCTSPLSSWLSRIHFFSKGKMSILGWIARCYSFGAWIFLSAACECFITLIYLTFLMCIIFIKHWLASDVLFYQVGVDNTKTKIWSPPFINWWFI